MLNSTIVEGADTHLEALIRDLEAKHPPQTTGLGYKQKEERAQTKTLCRSKSPLCLFLLGLKYPPDRLCGHGKSHILQVPFQRVDPD